MLYYNDENLMFASLASNRRQRKKTEADNLTKVDMSVVFQKVCPEPVPRTDIVGELLGNSFITPILGLPRVHRQSSLRNSGNPHDG